MNKLGMMEFAGNELIVLLFKAYLIVLFSGILIIPFVPLRIKPVISIVSVSLVALITGYIAANGFSSGGIELLIDGGSFLGTIPLRIDALSSWFILIINFISVTGILYGAGYMRSAGGEPSVLSFHWILYILFQSSMIFVTIVQHSIAFILCWEVMSLTSLFLVLHDYTNPKVLKAGINYLVQMHISVVFLTVAFIWVYFKTGTFDFKGIGAFFSSNVNIWLFLVFFAGFGMKAGFFGLHTWLPQAHPVAPSHISGVMSGVIVKLGIYGIFRIISFLKSDELVLGEIILTLSVITGLFGIMNASVHRDFKKMLAYCTIENIGIIGIGIGIGLIGISKGQGMLSFLGFGGALLHVLNHSLFKSLLFFSAGSVYMQTHTRDMDKLGGIIRNMPKTAMLFLTGAIAIGGIPPLNGFISEFLIYCGIINGIHSATISQVTLLILTFAGLSVIGGLSLLTFSKTFSTIFLGNPRQELKVKPAEVSFLMLLPQYMITAVMLTVAFFPGLFLSVSATVIGERIFPSISFSMIEYQGYLAILKNISHYSVLFLFVVGCVFIMRRIFTHRLAEKYASTWGCGYVAPNERMQYTGKSFSKSLGKLMNFILIEKKEYTEIERTDTFPEDRRYRSFYHDVFESKIVDPVIHQITMFINMFQFIQNGRIQAYVIYGIVFILAIFIGTVLNFLN
jgi:hydrogenase-4 component B